MADNAEGGEAGPGPSSATPDAPMLPPSFLPSFANKATRELDVHIRRLERDLEVSQQALEENTDRITIMSEHLNNVKQELKYTQSRVDAKTKEAETEDHLKQLSLREAVSLSLC